MAILLPKLSEKGEIGRACIEFDNEAPLAQSSTNEKRRLEGKQVSAPCICGNISSSQIYSSDLQVRSHNKKARQAEKRLCWEFEKKGSCKYGDKCR